MAAPLHQASPAPDRLREGRADREGRQQQPDVRSKGLRHRCAGRGPSHAAEASRIPTRRSWVEATATAKDSSGTSAASNRTSRLRSSSRTLISADVAM